MRKSLLVALVATVGTGGCFLPQFSDDEVGSPLPPNDPPVAVLSLSTLEDPPVVGQPGALDASASQDPDGMIAQFQWSLVVQPQGSATTLLVNADGQGAQIVPDLPGVYTIELVVVDDLGASSEPASVSLDAVPSPNDLLVVISWDIDISDVDVHLVNITDGGQLFQAPFDCYYANMAPDWGPAGQVGNPTLDLDDVNGFGPENLSLPEPEPTSKVYRVIVHYYSDDGLGATTAAVQIYLHGILVWEGEQYLAVTGRTWDVVDVTLPDGTVTELGNVYDFTPF